MVLTPYDIMILVGVPTISAFIFQVFYTGLSKRFRKGKQEHIIINKALQALLRDRLREHYLHYLEKGSIDILDKENYDNLYQSYHILGKNGVMSGMHKQVMELPLIQKKK